MYVRLGEYLTREQPSRWLGLVVSLVGVTACTALIYPLADVMPVQSAGLIYLLVVLAISIWWGLALGVATSLAATTAFNFFHIPPTGQFNVARSDDVVVLVVFLVTAIVAGVLADVARTSARHGARLRAELIEAEAVRRSDQLKTALLRAVSHDLRSPLTAIAAAGEALASPRLSDAERAELAADVTADAARLSELVGKLLDVSRLQAGAVAPHADWCSLEEIIRSAIEELTAGSQPIVECDEAVPLVNADAVQLERAISNLLENAERHGGGARSVFVERRGDSVEVRVVDFGPGVSPDDAERIFEPFVTYGDGASTAGLGLAIARGFVEANGGKVRHETTPGGGSTFVVDLPIDVPDASADDESSGPVAA